MTQKQVNYSGAWYRKPVAEEFDQVITIFEFPYYVGNKMTERQPWGKFLLIILARSYLLNQEFWKDVH